MNIGPNAGLLAGGGIDVFRLRTNVTDGFSIHTHLCSCVVSISVGETIREVYYRKRSYPLF